ncbi:MAG: hypothetical protein H6700_01990 [Myxococcales bacterium]|nr:hypothetical protein [Myxococcales bacterium]MCB9521158.1 hypothetical protein [Myxococcales bacterium]MCB9530516.1 hypothetical protein [Myxococcales bacterium]
MNTKLALAALFSLSLFSAALPAAASAQSRDTHGHGTTSTRGAPSTPPRAQPAEPPRGQPSARPGSGSTRPEHVVAQPYDRDAVEATWAADAARRDVSAARSAAAGAGFGVRGQLAAAEDALRRGELALARGRFSEARAQFSVASSLAGDTLALAERERREARRLAAEYARLDASVDTTLSQARAFYDYGSPRAVDSVADRAVDLQQRARWEFGSGDVGAAIRLLSEANRLADQALSLAVSTRSGRGNVVPAVYVPDRGHPPHYTSQPVYVAPTPVGYGGGCGH